jgi:hypothetical protein
MSSILQKYQPVLMVEIHCTASSESYQNRQQIFKFLKNFEVGNNFYTAVSHNRVENLILESTF